MPAFPWRLPIIALAATLCACASAPAYVVEAPPNVVFERVAGDGGAIRGNIQLHISAMQADCSLNFLGSKAAGTEPLRLGLKPGTKHYVVVAFDDSGTNRAAMIDPLPGEQYRLQALLGQGGYELRLFQSAPGMPPPGIPVPSEPYACDPGR